MRAMRPGRRELGHAGRGGRPRGRPGDVQESLAAQDALVAQDAASSNAGFQAITAEATGSAAAACQANCRPAVAEAPAALDAAACGLAQPVGAVDHCLASESESTASIGSSCATIGVVLLAEATAILAFGEPGTGRNLTLGSLAPRCIRAAARSLTVPATIRIQQVAAQWPISGNRRARCSTTASP